MREFWGRYVSYDKLQYVWPLKTWWQQQFVDLLLDNLISVRNYEFLPQLRLLKIKTLQTNKTFYKQKNIVLFWHAVRIDLLPGGGGVVIGGGTAGKKKTQQQCGLVTLSNAIAKILPYAILHSLIVLSYFL